MVFQLNLKVNYNSPYNYNFHKMVLFIVFYKNQVYE